MSGVEDQLIPMEVQEIIVLSDDEVNANAQVPVIDQAEEVENSEDDEVQEARDYLRNLGKEIGGTLESPLHPKQQTCFSRLDSLYYWPRGKRIQ